MRAAVVGLGTMGPGLAATLARGGMEVNAFDVSADQRAKAPGLMQQATGVLSALAVPDKSSGKLPTVTETIAEACKGADLVVETVPEKLEIKAAVFKEIDGLVGKIEIADRFYKVGIRQTRGFLRQGQIVLAKSRLCLLLLTMSMPCGRLRCMRWTIC